MMHVALLANTAWLDEELVTLRHLVVGLVDESVRVTQALPERVGDIDALRIGGEPVRWRDSRLSWLRRMRLRSMREQLSGRGVDLVHALDGRLWPAAASLARDMNLPLVLTANDARDVGVARQLAGRLHPDRTVFTARTAPMVDALRRSVNDRLPVRLVRHGVRPGPGERLGFGRCGTTAGGVDAASGGDAGLGGSAVETPVHEAARCMVVTGTGVLDRAYAALLKGLVPVAQALPRLQVFLDGQIDDQRGLWRKARSLSLLRHISLIPRRIGHREEILGADVLVQPQRLGKARRLLTQAMANGVPVIAMADPIADYLVDGRTAWLVSEPSAGLWTQTLLRMLEDPPAAERLAASARAWSLEHCGVSGFVSAMMAAYRQAAGATLPFPAEAVTDSAETAETDEAG